MHGLLLLLLLPMLPSARAESTVRTLKFISRELPDRAAGVLMLLRRVPQVTAATCAVPQVILMNRLKVSWNHLWMQVSTVARGKAPDWVTAGHATTLGVPTAPTRQHMPVLPL
jgi:hypothetical protein